MAAGEKGRRRGPQHSGEWDNRRVHRNGGGSILNFPRRGASVKNRPFRAGGHNKRGAFAGVWPVKSVFSVR